MSPKQITTLGTIILAGVVANIPKIHKDATKIIREAPKDPAWDLVPTKERDAVVQYEPPTVTLRAPMGSLALWRYMISHGVNVNDITKEMVE